MHSMKKFIQPPRPMKIRIHEVRTNIMNNHVEKDMSKQTEWIERPRVNRIFLHRQGIKGRWNQNGEGVRPGCGGVPFGEEGIVKFVGEWLPPRL